MKRFQHSNVALFAVSLAFAGSSVLQGCGDSGGGGGPKDATIDVKLDGGNARLDVGGLDVAAERAGDLATEVPVAPPDTPGDSPAGQDGPVAAAEAGADQGPEVSAQPDAQPDGSSPGPEVAVHDVTPPSDLPVTDAPLGEDAPSVPDVAAPDSPVVLLDTAGNEPVSIDAPTIDAGIDTAAIEAGLPGAITGWPAQALDFGPTPCGGTAPAAKTFTLANEGGTSVTLTRARFAGSAGYSTDAEGKTIAAGESLVVTIHAPGVPQTANIPSTYSDTLTIETDVPNDDQHLVHVTESAQGAIMVWDTPTGFGSFEPLAPGYTSDAEFHVINLGNLAAQVTLSVTGEYAVTPATPITVPARGAVNYKATFVPSVGGAALGKLSMALSTPVALCQPLPAALSLTGTSINGAIALSQVFVSFTTECGPSSTAPANRTLTVTNTGPVAMHWGASLQAGSLSMFQIAPDHGDLTASDGATPSNDVTITPTRPTNPTLITDTINITTDAAGDTTHKVVITQTPQGDVVSVAPALIDLGQVPIVSPQLVSAPVTVTLRNDANTGSAPAVVSLQMTGADAQYFTVTPAQVSIPAGGEVNVSVTFSPGANPGIVTIGNHVDLSATLQWQVGSEPNCGVAQGNVPAIATATLGQVSMSPAQLDFGSVRCNDTASPLQLTIRNSGSAAYQVTSISLINSTYYTVDAPTLPQTLTPAGTATSAMLVTVTPSKIPATVNQVPDNATYNGSLTIGTDIVGDSPHVVDLIMGAKGAIIRNTPWPTDWDFGLSPFPGSRQLFIPVINAGNVDVTAKLTDIIVAVAQKDVFSIESANLAANSTSNIVAKFQPTLAASTFTATANLELSVVDPNDVFCQPLPSGWNSTTHNIHMQGQSAAAH